MWPAGSAIRFGSTNASTAINRASTAAAEKGRHMIVVRHWMRALKPVETAKDRFTAPSRIEQRRRGRRRSSAAMMAKRFAAKLAKEFPCSTP
jgi:hypothetical protein